MKAKDFDYVLFWVEDAGFPKPTKEFRFCLPRRWRVDYAFLDEKVAVEIEGGVWLAKFGGKSRHMYGKGYLGDMAKYNTLATMGWRLLRFTPQMISSGEFLEMLGKCLKGEKKCISAQPTGKNIA